MSVKRIIILGATGSIGSSTLRVLRQHRADFQVVGIAAHSNAPALIDIAREFDVPHLALYDESAYHKHQELIQSQSGLTWHIGPSGLQDLATLPPADLVVSAIVGTAALMPTLAAIEAGKDIALANKEILVLAGSFMTAAAEKHQVQLLPTDSEHNALFQCLQGHPRQHLQKIWLTASGGAFRDFSPEQMAQVTLAQALQHPNWDMGPKVTIDSASMANKGLEVIEAKWLFDLQPDDISVLVHPQSIVHSMVQFIDGSVLAQLCPPSMTFSIQHCLYYPDRRPGVDAPLPFDQLTQLEFRPPCLQQYPCLALAFQALRSAGAYPAIFNAANEVAVAAFVQERIRFQDIPSIISDTLASTQDAQHHSLEAILHSDQQARLLAKSKVEQIA